MARALIVAALSLGAAAVLCAESPSFDDLVAGLGSPRGRSREDFMFELGSAAESRTRRLVSRRSVP